MNDFVHHRTVIVIVAAVCLQSPHHHAVTLPTNNTDTQTHTHAPNGGNESCKCVSRLTIMIVNHPQHLVSVALFVSVYMGGTFSGNVLLRSAFVYAEC